VIWAIGDLLSGSFLPLVSFYRDLDFVYWILALVTNLVTGDIHLLLIPPLWTVSEKGEGEERPAPMDIQIEKGVLSYIHTKVSR
jgi:hypothetical protein